mgnify:CR=1 FL=1
MRPHPLSTSSLLIALCALPSWAAQGVCPQNATAAGATAAASGQACQAVAKACPTSVAVAAGASTQSSCSQSSAACQAHGDSQASAGCKAEAGGSVGVGFAQAEASTPSALPMVLKDGEVLSFGRSDEGLCTGERVDLMQLIGASGSGQGSERGYMGVSLEVEEGAVTIGSIFDGSPAANAGLRAGDRIVRLGSEEIGSSEALTERLGSSRPGDEVRLLIDRDGWTRELTLTLAPGNPAWGMPGVGGTVEVMEVPGRIAFAPSEHADIVDESEGSEDGIAVFKLHSNDASVEEGSPEGDWVTTIPHGITLVHPDGTERREFIFEVEREDGGVGHVFRLHGKGKGHGEAKEDGNCCQGQALSKAFAVPGGECKIEVRVEGDGHGGQFLQNLDLAPMLKRLDIKIPHVVVRSTGGRGSAECKVECQVKCEESCEKACEQKCEAGVSKAELHGLLMAHAGAKAHAGCCAKASEEECDEDSEDECDEACEATCEEECEEECDHGVAKECETEGLEIALTEEGEGDGEQVRVRRFVLGEGQADYLVVPRTPGGRDVEIQRDLSLPRIAARVRGELAEIGPFRDKIVARRAPQGTGANANELRGELEALRAEVAELRNLRNSLSEIENLRNDLEKLLKALDSKRK